MFCEIMLTAALFAMSQDRALPEIPLTRMHVLPPSAAYLVKAHALTATKGGDQGGDRGRAQSFEIDHVYVGPADLKGKTFTAKTYVYMSDFNMPYYDVTPIHKGEVGILWIIQGEQGLASIYEFLGSRQRRPADAIQQRNGMWTWDKTVFLPALKDGTKAGDARYDMSVARAEVFERIYHASDKDRLKVIDDYVRSRDSIKGAAALMLLLRGNEPTPVQSFEDWSAEYRRVKREVIAGYVLPFAKDESLSPRVQWEVAQLLAAKKDGWKGSREEWQMIRRWYAGTWKEEENVPWDASEEKVLADLLAPAARSVFWNTRPFTLAEGLELAVDGLANGTRSDRFKAELIIPFRSDFIVGFLRKRDPESLANAEKGFDFLVDTIRKDRTSSRRIAAAKLLAVFTPLSEQKTARIRGLSAGLPADVKEEVANLLSAVQRSIQKVDHDNDKIYFNQGLAGIISVSTDNKIIIDNKKDNGLLAVISVAKDAKFTDVIGQPLADGLKSAELRFGAVVTVRTERVDGKSVITALTLGANLPAK